MRPDRRRPAPAPLQLRNLRRREEETRAKSPSPARTRTPSPSRTALSGRRDSPRWLLSPEEEVSTPSSPEREVSTPSATQTPSLPIVSSPTVTVTLSVKGPTVTATASQIPLSPHTIPSSTQSETLLPSATSTAGAGASKAIIPIKAVGFIAGITGAAGALIAIGLFVFFWRRRRAAAAEAAESREGE